MPKHVTNNELVPRRSNKLRLGPFLEGGGGGVFGPMGAEMYRSIIIIDW